MVESEFGVNRMRTWIHHALLPGCWWWCNDVDVFLAHFWPLIANCALFKCHGLPEWHIFSYFECVGWHQATILSQNGHHVH